MREDSRHLRLWNCKRDNWEAVEDARIHKRSGSSSSPNARFATHHQPKLVFETFVEEPARALNSA